MGLALYRCLEVLDVLPDRLVAPVADRPGAGIDDAVPAPSASPAKRFGDTLGPRVVVGKSEVLPARRPRSSFLTRSGWLALEAVESLDDVAEEARFALLAVRDDIDARFDLLPHHIRYRLAHEPCELFAVVGLTVFPQSKERDQGVGSGQAAHMGRKDSFRAALHRLFPFEAAAGGKSKPLSSHSRTSSRRSSELSSHLVCGRKYPHGWRCVNSRKTF